MTDTPQSPPRHALIPLRHLSAGVLAGGLLGLLDGYTAATTEGMEVLDADAVSAAAALLAELSMIGGAALGLFAGVVVWTWMRLSSEGLRARLGAALRRPRNIAIGVALLAIAFGVYEYFKRLDWGAIPWAFGGMLAASAALYGGVVLASRRLRGRGVVGLVGLVAVALLAAGFTWDGAEETPRTSALLRLGVESTVGVRLLPPARDAFDGDGDGFPSRLCTVDCDCDDGADTIFPGAAEVADNGVDEDCNGVDLSAEQLEAVARLFEAQRRATPEAPVEAPTVIEDPFLKLTREGPPNILFIVVDTLRADHLGCYGYDKGTSPHIDALCERSAVFDQARATGSQTRFSVPPMLTGKYFSEIERSSGKWPKVHRNELLMAERLKALGYHTASFHSIGYFQKVFRMNQGFDHYDVSVIKERWPLHHNPTSDLVTDRVFEYVDAETFPREDPWFIWAYYGDPHAIFLIHDAYVERYGRGRTGLYDGEIAFTDEHLGRLLDGLSERGLLEDTLIVFTSDHGEGLNPKEDHGHVYHGPNLYDEVIRVPLLIAGPGIPARRVPTSVSLLDLLPTLLEVAGGEPDPEQRGVSLVPWLRGQDFPHPPVFFEKHKGDAPHQKGMVLWPWKVHWIPQYNRFKIYNIEDDPGERVDRYDDLPDETRDHLTNVIQYWKNEMLKERRSRKF